MTRRSLIGAAAGIAAAGGGSSAAETARTKGPIVWLDMDQKELDDAYDQLVYAPNRDQILKRCARNSELARERLGEPKRLSYGPTPVEAFDLFLCKAKNAPLQVFVHGGAWRGQVARDQAYLAETFVAAGAHFIALDFNNVLETGGDLMPMADQLRRAIIWIWKNAESFGGDPERIYVSGHSSGGHLAAVLLTTDFLSDFDLPPNIIKGGVCASGMYDLKPVRLSKRSSYVKFTDEMEARLSPQRRVANLLAPVVVVYGSLETPEFQRQARDFAAAAKAASKDVSLLLLEGYNHFEVIEQLANPLSPLSRAALAQMKLG
jgi:arylformamidase